MRARVEVDLNAIYRNVCQTLRWIGSDAQIMAVVKADAYGHGLLPVAHTALAAGARWLGIATVEEGILLRQASIVAPICMLCPFAPDEAEQIIAYGLTPLCGDTKMLESLSRAAATVGNSSSLPYSFSSALSSSLSSSLPAASQASAKRGRLPAIHLDLDTGIGRSGAQPAEAVALWQQAVRAGFPVTGVATHFADADNLNTNHTPNFEPDIELDGERDFEPAHACPAAFVPPRQKTARDASLTQLQEAAFATVLTALKQAGAHFEWIHATNSAATLQRYAPAGTLARPGLMLYGISPFPTEGERAAPPPALHFPSPIPSDFASDFASEIASELTPALALKAAVAVVRLLPQGHPISYGATVRLTRPSRVATVLIGYGDGYPRRLSNGGEMLIRGQRVPILGRICMDQTVVDVTDIPDVVAGDEAVCIGVQGKERITVEELARRIDTTPHEITTCLTARLPRLYLPLHFL